MMKALGYVAVGLESISRREASFRLRRVAGAVEGNDGGFVVDDCFDMDGLLPEFVQVAERVLRVVLFQLDPHVFVEQVQLAAVAVVDVLHVDERAAVVGQAVQKLLLDLLELARGDLVGFVSLVEGERNSLCFAQNAPRSGQPVDPFVVLTPPTWRENATWRENGRASVGHAGQPGNV